MKKRKKEKVRRKNEESITFPCVTPANGLSMYVTGS